MSVILISMIWAVVVVPQIDPELSSYIAARRKVMDETSRPIADRETVAIELAAALDRAAWAKPDAASRHALWAEARALLDGFSARNPNHPRARLFAFQGAVYLWAEGDGWRRLVERNPTDQDAAARAASAFEAAANRLRPLIDDRGPGDDALSQNIRFRLAQALREWAKLLPDRPAAHTFQNEALAALSSRPISEKGLVGYAETLRAELLAADGQFDEAAKALEKAASSEPPPPIAERLEVLIPIAAGRHKIDEARKALESAEIEKEKRQQLQVRLGLAERSTMVPGKERDEVERRLFHVLHEMKELNLPESRLSLLDVARTIDEPGPTNDPQAWSLLAEGAALLGQTERAATLNGIAADRYEAAGRKDEARTLRFRAAALLFEAGRYTRAVDLLDLIIADRDAGALRARAGMLKALAIGRGLDASVSGMTRGRYLKALGDQIALFPNDATLGEARWLLGRAHLELGDRVEAERFWEAIPRTQARWIDASLSIAALRRRDLEDRRLVDRAANLKPDYLAAIERLDALASEARDDAERADVMLERITLELTPEVGNAADAMSHVERLRVLPLRADQRRRTEHLRILAMAATGSTTEAEGLARNIPDDEPFESLLSLSRELDHLAADTEGDRASQRIGEIARIVADRLDGIKGLSGSQSAEVILRRARARIQVGDEAGARRILEAIPLSPLPFSSDAERLSDLADALSAVGWSSQAIPAYRALARLLPDGSPRWFETRLQHARALEADLHRDAARNLLKGTRALYPNLGGPVMEAKFAKLSRKLAGP